MARPQLIAERDLRLIERWPRLHDDSDQVIETLGHPQIGFVEKVRGLPESSPTGRGGRRSARCRRFGGR
jgi:hypothetical protein